MCDPGKAEPVPELSSLDGLPYTTLGYTNGPAFGRQDLTDVDTGKGRVICYLDKLI